MSMILNIISSENNVVIDVSEDALICIENDDIESQIPSDLKKCVNFYLDRKLSYDECSDILKKLKNISGEDGLINIFTTGHNFNDMMKCIGSREYSGSYVMHVDDHNGIRDIIDTSNVICGLNFSRICCDCYFSERYLLNFNASEFDALCGIEKCKFDRDKLKAMRLMIENVWDELIPANLQFDSFDQFNKVELVLNYVTFNNMIDNYLELFGDVSREDAQVMFANLLLNNYVAKVCSSVVQGKKVLGDRECTWLMTTIDGVNYSHGLAEDERFVNLEEIGYVNGRVLLDDEHKHRDDFVKNINSYGSLDYDDYSNLKYVLEYRMKENKNVSRVSFGTMSSMPPLFPEGSEKPVLSCIKKRIPKKMPLLFPNGRNKQ